MKKKHFINNNTGNFERITPPYIIEKVRKVMGSIDVDPASSKQANKIIKAKRIYTKKTDGLSLEADWAGNVWINPPFKKPLMQNFIYSACQLIQLYNRDECAEESKFIILTPNSTETKWCHQLFNTANSCCFLDKRIKFLNKDLTEIKGSPTHGHILFNLGFCTKKFKRHFKKLGKVVKLK